MYKYHTGDIETDKCVMEDVCKIILLFKIVHKQCNSTAKKVKASIINMSECPCIEYALSRGEVLQIGIPSSYITR